MSCLGLLRRPLKKRATGRRWAHATTACVDAPMVVLRNSTQHLQRLWLETGCSDTTYRARHALLEHATSTAAAALHAVLHAALLTSQSAAWHSRLQFAAALHAPQLLKCAGCASRAQQPPHQGLARSALPLHRCARRARPLRAMRLDCMSDARSSRRLQPFAAAAPPRDRQTRRKALAKSVSKQHCSTCAHHARAEDMYPHRAWASGAQKQPSVGARARNVKGGGLAECTHREGGCTAPSAATKRCAHRVYSSRNACARASALVRTRQACAARRPTARCVSARPTYSASFAPKLR